VKATLASKNEKKETVSQIKLVFVNSNAGCTSTSGICLQYLIQQFNRNGVSPILVTKNPNLCFNCQHNSFSLALGFQNMGAT